MWKERAFISIIILGLSFLVFSFLVLNNDLIPRISRLYWKVRLGKSREFKDSGIILIKGCSLLNKVNVDSAGTESEIRFLLSLEPFLSVITVG